MCNRLENLITTPKTERFSILNSFRTVAHRGGGVLQKSATVKTFPKRPYQTGKNNPAYVHGDAAVPNRAPEYKIWASMKARCGPKESHRKWYADRGITVCKRWRDYTNFLSDMGRRPSPDHTLERRDNNLGYSKDNCYWATRIEQANNRRNNVHINYNGETKTLAQWSAQAGVPAYVITQRISRGWTLEETFSTPVGVGNTRLSKEVVLEIRRLWKQRPPMNVRVKYQAELGRRYGVNQGAISKIVLRQSWKHI